mmetsp:Transcript_16898/g.38746  ORF Transcript_16898/g.38746 Transcript_16898/m.38746 type:complete len:177 (-) Transcript_16898:253-783(-)
MMLQQTRVASSLPLTRLVGRQFNVASIGCVLGSRNHKFSKQACARIAPPLARGYSMTANYSPAMMMTMMMAPRSHGCLSFRELASALWSMVTVPRPVILPQGLQGGLPLTTREAASSCSNSPSILSWAVWLIKRTYQPSLLKKKRQCGYMKRNQSVGGRRILKRRRQKGRKRLFGA